MKYNDINNEAAADTLFSKIETIKLTGEWSDDHIPCATVTIILKDGTIHENHNFPYIGSGGIAALTYYEYPQAQIDFFNNNIPQILDMAIDAGFDYVGTIKYASQEEADELDNKTELLILQLAELDVNTFEAE